MEKVKQFLKKELIIYLVTLVVLTLIMHIDIITDPAARFSLMSEKGNYSHPFTYSFVIYFAILVLRKVIDFIGSLFQKKED